MARATSGHHACSASSRKLVHLSLEQVAVLGLAISVINAYDRIGVASAAVPPLRD
jgi:hypothetical protein